MRGVPLQGICGRIAAVRDEIVTQSGRAGCAAVSEADLRALRMLDLTRKGMRNLPENSFAGMSGMTHLYLTDNRITSLPANVFAGLTSLTELKLDQLSITTLPANVFADLGALLVLDLTGSALESLPVGAFNGLFPGVDSGSGPDGLFMRGLTPPDPPRDLQLTVRNGELRAQWSEVPGAHYQLRWREAGAAEWAREDAAATAGAVHTIAGLRNDMNYEVRVAAVPIAPAISGTSLKAWKAAKAQAAPKKVPPDAPRQVRATAGNARIDLAWQAPAVNGGSAVTGYKVRWKTPDAAAYSDPVAASGAAYAVENLNNGTTYQVQVAAESALGVGEYADAPPATPHTVPNAPRAPAVEERDRQLHITWQAPADNGGAAVTTYHVRWKSADEAAFAAKNAAELSAEVFAHTISGLENGATYQVQTAAENRAGRGDYSDAARGTPRTVPGAPQSLAVAPGDAMLKVTWESPASDGGAPVLSYRLRWKLAEADNFAPENAAELSAEVFAREISGLQNGASYEVQIAAKNAAGFGAEADAVSGAPRTVPGAPQSVAVAPGDAELAVMWAAPSADGGAPITGYRVRWKLLGAAGFVAGDAHTTDAETLRYSITGLQNGATYSLEIAAENAAGLTAAAARGVPRTVPGAPQSVVVAPGDAMLKVTWAAPSADGGAPVTSYRLRWKLAEAANFAPENAAELSADVFAREIPGLQNGATYEVQIAAGNIAGLGADADAVSGAPRTVPGAPQAFRAVPGNTELKVMWTMPSADGGAPITSYRLRWKADGASGFAERDTIVFPADVFAHTIAGLQNGAAYQLEVAAKNAADFGAAATVQATPRAIPGAPQAVKTAPGDAELQITWEPPASDGGAPVLSYRLRWNLADASDFADSEARFISADGSGVFAHTISGLRNGAAYSVEVTAKNRAGFGAPEVAKGTPRTVPGAPRDVAVAPGNAQLRVTWRAPSDDGGAPVTAYTVRWKAAAAAEYASAEITDPTLHTIPGLTNGTTYEVQVAAKNEAGEGAYADAVQAAPRTVPGAPQSAEVEPRNEELRISWQAPADNGGANVTTYHVRWKMPDDAEHSSEALSADNTDYTIAGLQNGATYEVQIAAENAAGEGEAAAASGIPRTVPGKPQAVTANASNTKLSITAAWEPPASDGGSPVTTYRYRWALESGVVWKSANDYAGDAAARAYTIQSREGLESGVEYQVQIAAVNAAGAGEWSDAASGTPWQFDLDIDDSGAAEPRDGQYVANFLSNTPLFSEGGAVRQRDADTAVATASYKLSRQDLDVDKDGKEDGIDGILIARHMLGLRGAALTAGITEDRFADIISKRIGGSDDPADAGKFTPLDLEVNGDGKPTSADAIVVARYLLGVSGRKMTSGQVAKSGPSSKGILAKIQRGIDGGALDVDENGVINDEDGTMVWRFFNDWHKQGATVTQGYFADEAKVLQNIEAMMPQTNPQ